MPEVWTAAAGGLILVDNDPGVVDISDPMSGLGESEALHVQWLLTEGKSLGTAKVTGKLLQRDIPLRFTAHLQGVGGQRKVMRKAATNSKRDVERVTREARQRIYPLFVDLLNGVRSLDEVQERTAVEWRYLYGFMRDAGRGASGLAELGGNATLLKEEEQWFRGAVREELRYWNTFLEQVHEGEVSAKRAHERFNAYVKALRFMYEATRAQALPDNVLLYFAGPRDDRRCAGCEYLTERSPFTKKNIPAVPRDGQTSCLTHCRHRIIVRVPQSFQMVEARQRALPSRKTMVRKLKKLKSNRAGRYLSRPGGRAQNPFRRQKMTQPREWAGITGMKVGVPGIQYEKPGDIEYASPKARRFGESKVSLPLKVEFDDEVTGAFCDGNVIRVGKLRSMHVTNRRDALLRAVGQWFFDRHLGNRKAGELDLWGFSRFFTDPEALRKENPRTFQMLSDNLRGLENRVREWVDGVMKMIGEPLKEDDVGVPPEDADLDLAVRRAGFDDAEQAKVAADTHWKLKRLKKLPKRVRRRLVAPKSKKTLKRALQDQRLGEAVRSHYDTLPYASMELRDVLRLLDGALDGREINRELVSDLLERVLGVLEFSYLNIRGRREATMFSRLLHRVAERLVGLHLGESAAEGARTLDLYAAQLGGGIDGVQSS